MMCRCVTMLTNLYHGECDNNGMGTGTATIGSSEAIMLGGLAMKKAWQAKRKAAGKPYDKPNLVRLYFLWSEPLLLVMPWHRMQQFHSQRWMIRANVIFIPLRFEESADQDVILARAMFCNCWQSVVKKSGDRHYI